MRGDGNGWVRCWREHRHWGVYGAAGLLVTDGTRVLLQHRAGWTHEGNTWALPGGARDSHEDALTAALREAAEETSLVQQDVTPFATWVDDHREWSYTTILAHPCDGLEVRSTNAESDAMGWWAIADVDALALHRGFRETWPALRDVIAGRIAGSA